MEKKECLMQPKIAAKMMDLQMEHALPVNIIIGEVVDGLKTVTLEYELIDHYAVSWLITKATAFYTGLPAVEIMDDDD